MNKKQIEKFFHILSELHPADCEVILTGAAAGALYGRIRATLDIDFAANARNWPKLSRAVEKASQRTGIEVQYGEDIDRWSSISLLDYQRHTYIYRQIGSVKVKLMEPPYWAIGKLSRYLDSDIRDMVIVFKKTRTKWQELTRVAGTALAKSPRSTACFLFRKQTEDFLKKRGRSIWGKTYEPQAAIDRFHRYAGIRALS